MNPTKLVLHFSDFSVIFYAIYKNQEITFTIGVHLLQQGPWKDFGFRNVVPGQIPAIRRRIPAEEGRGRIYSSLALGIVGWTGMRRLRRWGALAASGAGRRDWQSRRPGPPSVACGWAASCCG
jgi:hypothetical protein